MITISLKKIHIWAALSLSSIEHKFTMFLDRYILANNVDPDQTFPYDQGLH